MRKLVFTALAVFVLSFGIVSGQSATPVFDDSLETGDLSYSENGYSWIGLADDGVGRAEVNTENPYSGNYSIILETPAQADGEDLHMHANLRLPDVKEFWMEYYMWVPSTYYHRDQSGPTNNKFWQAFDERSSVNLGIIPEIERVSTGESMTYRYVPYESSDVDTSNECCGWRYDNPVPVITFEDRGTWVQYRHHVKASDVVEPGREDDFNGVYEFWKNGNLIHSDYGLGIRNTDSSIVMDQVRILGWANSGYDEVTPFYIDDVKFYEEDPGWPSNATEDNTSDITVTDSDGDGANSTVDCDDNDPDVQTTISCDYDGNSCGTYDLCTTSCPTPPSETCDGIDNDCDGTVDEGCDFNQSEEGMVLYYTFDDGTATDFSGYNNHGTLSGVSPQEGMYGEGMYFDGGSTMEVPHSPELNLGNSYSFTAWVRFDNVSGSVSGLVSKGGSSWSLTQDNAGGSVVDGRVRLNSVHDNNDYFTSWLFPYQDWFHLAAVYNGSAITYYVNGTETTSSDVGDPSWTSDSLVLGWAENSFGWTGYLDGLMDEVRLYNTALTASEVQEAMSQSNISDTQTNTSTGDQTTNQTNTNQTFAKEDVNEDGSVNIFDLVEVASNIGISDNRYDMNDDGSVNIFDLVDVVNVIVETSASDNVQETDSDGDGVVASNDCDDSESSIYPGADEICDGVDNDCDGQVDENNVCSSNTSFQTHEPSSMSVIGSFNGTLKEGGDGSAFGIDDFGSWYHRGTESQIEGVDDSTNPIGSGSSLQFTFTPESSPGVVGANTFTGGPYDEIYVRTWLYYEEGWSQGHKHYYLGAEEGARANVDSPTQYYAHRPGGFYEELTNQNGHNFDVATAEDIWTNGEWHMVEYHYVAQSSPGVSDGEFYMYFDGEMVANNTAVNWVPSDFSGIGFNGLQWYAVTGATFNQNMSYRLGELYISGK